MFTIGAVEAKTTFPDLLDRVAHGEQFTIIDQGIPVAMLVPLQEKKRKNVNEVIEELLEFRHGKILGGLSHRDMIAKGRR